MSRIIYSLAFYLALPLVLMRLLYRSIREPGYRRSVAERFGFSSAQASRPIWIHAVSAGETVAAAPLVQQLVDDGHACLVTNMTPTGRDRVSKLLGDGVQNTYAPYDVPGAVRRFLKTHNPKLMITIDTELWPNTLLECHRIGVPTMLVNGRLSAGSAKGYARLSALVGPMLKSIDHLAVQTDAHRKRFVELGVDAQRITVTGSIKFDTRPREDLEQRLAQAVSLVAGRPVLLAASTHEGEEAILLRCFQSLRERVPDALLILAPRHTHRTDHVVDICKEQGLAPVLFTACTAAPAADGAAPSNGISATDGVLIVDTMGELDALFAVSRLAFIGGSLVPVGGHNLLEAVVAGAPVVMGSYLHNIDDIAQQFVDAGGMLVVEDESQLLQAMTELMIDAAVRDRVSVAATSVFEANQGALSRTLEIIRAVLPGD